MMMILMIMSVIVTFIVADLFVNFVTTFYYIVANDPPPLL